MAPRDKKPNKSKSSNGHDDDLKTKKSFFKRMLPGFKKKSSELSALCGNSVGFICYGPDNDLHVMPELQDNQQNDLTQILAKFNALSDHKRKHHACDIYDFPDLKGLSSEGLRNTLDTLNSQLVGVQQKKISLLRRGNLKNPKLKETGEDDHLKVSDYATISNRNVASSDEGQRLGFGGDVFRGSHETVSNLGSCAASKVSKDVGVSYSTLLYYFPVDPMPVTDGAWDHSCKDMGATTTDSFTASTYKTPVTN